LSADRHPIRTPRGENAPKQGAPPGAALEGGLIQHLTTAVVVLDEDLRFSYLNNAAESLLSLSARQALGQRLADVVLTYPGIAGLADRALATGQSFTERDIEMHPPGGATLNVDCVLTPLIQGGPLGGQILMEILSVDRHLKLVREERIIAQGQMTQSMLAGIAHEVKNPLGGIRGAAQLLARELRDEGTLEYTRIIIGEADRLRELVDRMLEPNRAIKPHPVNVHEVLEHVRQLVEVSEPGKRVVVERDYDPSLPPVLADRDRLVQAFLNLLKNAVQAVGEGGRIGLRTRIQRQVTIGSKLHRLVLRAEVMDDGPGVPPDLADSLFMPLVTGRAGGHGLGLPMAQSIVQRMGGLIGFTSEPGNTVFTVWLPLAAERSP